jgi:hypothetical protein
MRKHYYAFGEPCADGSHGIQPVTHSDSLRKGTIGHSILGNYYINMMNGYSVDQSYERAFLATQQEFIGTSPDLEAAGLMAEATIITRNYINRYGQIDADDWEPLAIEREFEVPLNVYDLDLTFVFKPDGIFRQKKTGKVWIWDHKFLYNFYQESTLAIQPQMTRYAMGLKRLGYDVHGALYNMLSTRPNVKTNPFARLEKPLSEVAMKRYWDEMIQSARGIQELKAMPNKFWEEGARRTASDFNCKHCPFLDLCSSDLEERPGRKLLVENFYEPNTYGYGKEEKVSV